MKIGIVGAGQAACTLIAELIRGQFDGNILVFNRESRSPYQRPPLSKSWLKTQQILSQFDYYPSPSKLTPQFSGFKNMFKQSNLTMELS